MTVYVYLYVRVVTPDCGTESLCAYGTSRERESHESRERVGDASESRNPRISILHLLQTRFIRHPSASRFAHHVARLVSRRCVGQITAVTTDVLSGHGSWGGVGPSFAGMSTVHPDTDSHRHPRTAPAPLPGVAPRRDGPSQCLQTPNSKLQSPISSGAPPSSSCAVHMSQLARRRLAQLDRPRRRCRHRPNHRCSEASLLEGLHARNRRATRRAHLVLELAGVLAGFEDHLGRALGGARAAGSGCRCEKV